MFLSDYRLLGGIHPETACVKNMLAFHGVTVPGSDTPFSEAMLFGVGGGLGASYMLWEFEKHGYPSLVLAFSHLSNYSVRYLEKLAGRLGASTQIWETSGRKKAAGQLAEALAAGQPALVWLDLGGPPYYRHYLDVGVAVAYGLEKDRAYVDRLARAPLVLDVALLAEARDRVPSFKNRIMTIEPAGPVALEAAIRDGLRDCVEYLSASSTSFSLPSLRKWARLLTDQNQKKSWPAVFPSGRGLYGTLRTVYEAIAHIGTDGGALRGMYADFLLEAADRLNVEALRTAASHYRDLHERWQTLARAALPDDVPEFKHTRELIDAREAVFLAKGSESLATIGPINDTLHALKRELNEAFPLTPSETTRRLRELQTHVSGIFEAERTALKELANVTASLP